MSNVIDLDSRRPHDVSDEEMDMLMQVLVDLRSVMPDAVLKRDLSERGDPIVGFYAHNDALPLVSWTRIGGREAWLDADGRERPGPMSAGV
jgi:hypothetical protein